MHEISIYFQIFLYFCIRAQSATHLLKFIIIPATYRTTRFREENLLFECHSVGWAFDNGVRFVQFEISE